MMLRLENIKKSYDTGSDRLEVLCGVDLTVGKGEIVAIVVPSGVAGDPGRGSAGCRLPAGVCGFFHICWI